MIANYFLKYINKSIVLRVNHLYRNRKDGNRGGREGKSNSLLSYKKDGAVDYIYNGELYKYGERCFRIYPHLASDN